MKIVSIYNRDKAAAIFLIEENGDQIILLDYWNTFTGDKNTVAAAERLTADADATIINADLNRMGEQKLSSSLGAILKASGIHISNDDVLAPTKPIAGLAALESLLSQNRIDTDSLSRWVKLKAEIDSSSQKEYSVEVMALFQALIHTAFSDGSYRPFKNTSIPVKHGDDAVKEMML